MADLLFRWPEAAKFGRRVPKAKFYEHGTVNTAVREKFISEVQRITWAYKLAEATINLPGTATVPEVQVFTIDAKASDVGEPILNAIDKAIPFPIIFEITRQSARVQVRVVQAVGEHTKRCGAKSAHGPTLGIGAKFELVIFPLGGKIILGAHIAALGLAIAVGRARIRKAKTINVNGIGHIGRGPL